MEIRKAAQTDIPGMLCLLQQVGQVHHEIRPDIFCAGAQKYGEAELLALLKDEDRPIFVATEGAFVAGYCFCVRKAFPGSSVQTSRTEFYIDDLCVDETRRGTDIATALFAHARDCAKALGCHSVTLNVWCGNHRAMAFYEKMGLKPRNIMLEMLLEEK